MSQPTQPDPPARGTPTRYPACYFFYGTLKDAEVLKSVVGLKEEPKYREAKIIGYALTTFEEYLALIKGESGQVVTGSGYLVQCQAHAEKLAYYETSAYELADCRIFFTDGGEPSEVAGKTFMLADDQ